MINDNNGTYCRTDPRTGQQLTTNELIPNITLRNSIRAYLIATAAADASSDVENPGQARTE